MAGAKLISDQFSSQTLWIETGAHLQNSATLLTCSSNLTLSIGATAVLEMAAATPPAKKSLRKLRAWSDILKGSDTPNPLPFQIKEGTKSPYRVVGRYLTTQLDTPVESHSFGQRALYFSQLFIAIPGLAIRGGPAGG